ncbi:MAG: hypothetical protein ACK5BE_07065 [Alphaproteobacteria bacterium]|jgi:TolA-binding protein
MGFFGGGRSNSSSSSNTNNIDNKQTVDGGSTLIGATGGSSLNYTINNANSEAVIDRSLNFGSDALKTTIDFASEALDKNFTTLEKQINSNASTISQFKDFSENLAQNTTATKKLLDQLPLIILVVAVGVGGFLILKKK